MPESYVVFCADSAMDPNRPLICVFDSRDGARDFCRVHADKGYEFIGLPRNPDFKAGERGDKDLDLEKLKPDLKMPLKDPKPRDLPTMDPFAVRPVEKPVLGDGGAGVAFPGPFTQF